MSAADPRVAAVVAAARDYRDYLRSDDLVPYGGDMRRSRLFSALDALDALAGDAGRGVAGDRCGSGSECGRLGCPECQA